MWELQWVLKGFGQFGRKVTNRGSAVYDVKPISASGQGNPLGLEIIQAQIRKEIEYHTGVNKEGLLM